MAAKLHLFERQKQFELKGNKMEKEKIVGIISLLAISLLTGLFPFQMIPLLVAAFPLFLYHAKSEKTLQIIEAVIFSLVGGISLIVKIVNPLIFSNFPITYSALCLFLGVIAYLFASSKYRIIPLDIMAYTFAAAIALWTRFSNPRLFRAGVIIQIGLLLYWIYLYKKDRSANPSETKTIRKIFTTSPKFHVKKKTIQLLGYLCCWICAPVFGFMGALCDHGAICDFVVVPLVALAILGGIPLFIGQIFLYRSKRPFPPLDALFFLAGATCGITVLLFLGAMFILLPIGIILWGVGFVMEIVLLFYVYIYTSNKKHVKPPLTRK